jgi:WD40 repeat protein
VVTGEKAAANQALGNPCGINQIAFTRDGRTLLTSGQDALVRMWEVSTGKEIRQIAVGWASNFAFSPDGNTVAAAGVGASVRFWDLATGKEHNPFGGHQYPILSLAFSPDGQTLASAAALENSIRLWKTATGQEVRQIEGHGARLRTFALSRDWTLLVTAGSDNIVRVWDVRANRLLRQWKAAEQYLHSLALSSDNRTVVTVDEQGVLSLWDVGAGRQIRHWKAAVSQVVFAPDNKTLYTYNSKLMQVWDVATGHELRQFAAGQQEENFPSRAAFSPDGRLVACSGKSGAIHLYEVATGREIRHLAPSSVGPSDHVQALAFSPDGRMLASGAWYQGTIRLWEVATGRERCQLSGHLGRVLALVFSPDGNLLASGSEDTTVLVWDIAGRGRTAESLERSWANLAGEDAPQAFRAFQALVAAGDHGVVFLRERLRHAPADAAVRKRIDRLMADLDHDDFAIRERAARELEALRDAAEPALRRALQGRPSEEVRRRVEGLLHRLEVRTRLERLRELRAVEGLEHVGTADARQLLASLAKGGPEDRLTQEAKASLGRLNKLPRSD